MSIDRSLRSSNTLVRHRNVLNRVERLEKLKDKEKWAEGKTIFGLPKVEHRKMVGKKEKKADEAVEGAAAPAAGTAAAPAAAPAKGAAPAAKGAAPAAKGAAPAAAKPGAKPAKK